MNTFFADSEGSKKKVIKTTKDVDSPIYKLKSILKEYENQTIKNEENLIKRENISNELKSTLSLVNENPKKKFNDLITSLDNWIHSTKMEMEITKNALQCFEDSTANDKTKKKDFYEKFHIYRESMLSTLFKSDKNMKSLYFLILTLFTWFFVWVLINDKKITGSFIDYNFWTKTFSGLHYVIKFWIVMFLYSLQIIFLVKYIEKDAEKCLKVRYVFYAIYLVYQISIYLITFWFIFSKNLRVVCSFIIGTETTRFSLKMHGYFREKILYGLKEYHMEYASFMFVSKSNTKTGDKNLGNMNFNNGSSNSSQSENSDENVNSGKKMKIMEFYSDSNQTEKLEMINPSKRFNENDILVEIKIQDFKTEIKKYLYYFICPSLIYRDDYPRLSYHRPHYILAHIINFTCCIFFYYILMRYICDPYFNYSKIQDYFSILHFLFDTFRFAIPGVCFLVVGFFLLLHTWMNLWSEIILHGDRRFYEDWWNCTNFEEYYRKWNMVVHEWLYYYIYNDVVRLSKGKLSRFQAKLFVFGLSVLVHEIIVWQALGFFFPILAFFFGGPGIIFTYIKPKQQKFNIVFWTKLFLGKGLLLVFYLREFNMRSFFKENIQFTNPYHEFIPRTILMFMSPYKETILKLVK